MQREGGVKMIQVHMRKGFSMLMAVFVIILMASVAMFILNLSGKMVKETTTQYQREQAIILAKSYTEYAVLAVTANEHNTSNCLNTISGNYKGSENGYMVDVNISYIGNNLDTHCARKLNSNPITTAKSPLSIIVDVFVSYPDFDHPDDLNMTYHSRRLLKI